VGSQNFVDQAFMSFRTPQLGKLRLQALVGAFTSRYGNLGQYGTGQYGAAVIGGPIGTGEKLIADYAITDTFSIVLEHGVSGRFEKAPLGIVPGWENVRANQAWPSSWVHHAHAGFVKKGVVTMQAGLHYLSNFSQDDRGRLPADDPNHTGANEMALKDGKLDVFGVDFKAFGGPLGHFAAAAAYAKGDNVYSLSGMTLFGANTGESLSKRYLGQFGGGTGKLVTAGLEHTFSVAGALRYPEPFWGEGPDLTTSVFTNLASIQSADPNYDGKLMFKVGTEVTYRPLSWFAVSARYDFVSPNSKDSKETFHVISPKLIFKSNWTSHEQIVVHYARWLLGDHTQAFFPDDLDRARLDSNLVGVSFGMWW
jgi:hypothetical protein